ncbi:MULTISPECIES: hypothetical protein [Pseudomonas syringae group]|uniref:hypothetical protein n=1 Tax=Pseudomonas syringae group TaxID=136849 RepID=UPI001F37BB66|nr:MULTISPECIES: hypothetical protein [Pseudomonas syringae group]
MKAGGEDEGMMEEIARKVKELHMLSEVASKYYYISSDDVVYEDEESFKCQAIRCKRIQVIIEELSVESSKFFGVD